MTTPISRVQAQEDGGHLWSRLRAWWHRNDYRPPTYRRRTTYRMAVFQTGPLVPGWGNPSDLPTHGPFEVMPCKPFTVMEED